MPQVSVGCSYQLLHPTAMGECWQSGSLSLLLSDVLSAGPNGLKTNELFDLCIVGAKLRTLHSGCVLFILLLHGRGSWL